MNMQIKSWMQVLHSSSMDEQERAASALFGLSCREDYKACMVADVGCLRQLVAMLCSNNGVVREEAVKIIYNLAGDHPSAIAAVPGSIQLLTAVLSSNNLTVQAYAAGALQLLTSSTTTNQVEIAAVLATLDRPKAYAVGVLACGTDQETTSCELCQPYDACGDKTHGPSTSVPVVVVCTASSLSEETDDEWFDAVEDFDAP